MGVWTKGVVCGLCLLAAGAHARTESGALDIVRSPNNTQPVFVQPGMYFDSIVTNKPDRVRLESAKGVFRLSVESVADWRGGFRARVVVPADTPPGVYSLVVAADNREDAVHRSVYVRAALRDTYVVAHLTNLRVGEERTRNTELYRRTAAIRAGGADLVIVSGDLTAAGTREQWRIALDVINDCGSPTLVVPGGSDLAGGFVGDYLGPYPVARTFGMDGYLLWPAADTPHPDTVHAYLHTARRSIRAARWSIGITQTDGHALSVRTQLMTLVDAPLDALILGGPRIPLGVQPSLWGHTRVAAPARAQRGSVMWYRVTPRADRGLERIDPPQNESTTGR